MAYAENTEVPLDRSIGEILAMLRTAGANRIAQIHDPEQFTIEFLLNERRIRFRVTLPAMETMPNVDGRGRALSKEQRAARMDKAGRQRGRALMLIVKAKLESVVSEVETFEQAFLANVVMADGRTLYERVQEPIALEYSTGKVAPLLLAGPSW